MNQNHPQAAECDFYSEVHRLVDELAIRGLGYWAERIDSAVTSGSTGTEIFMGVRWVLRQLIDEPGLGPDLLAEAEEFVAYISENLEVRD